MNAGRKQFEERPGLEELTRGIREQEAWGLGSSCVSLLSAGSQNERKERKNLEMIKSLCKSVRERF